ncbi:MAG: glycosyltransferase [Blastochloris sp.]|nr:glycosyltransferase [Blastochloris sp.]
MDYPRISIVMPSYNQAQYLEIALRSVLEQQYPALDLIVIDGGSTDGSVEVLRQHADQLAYWVSEKDSGQADAINKGFARATGEVMAWLNSDDVYLPGALHAVGEIFARWPQVEWLTGWDMNIDERGMITTARRGTPKIRSLIRRGWYHGRGLGFIRQESTFWRRSLWEKSAVMSTRRSTMAWIMTCGSVSPPVRRW